jgi:hypothetical protein
LVTNETATPSADIAAVWVDAFERGAQTPAIPLCLKVSRQVMETNRDGCLGEFNYYTWQDCTSTFTMSVSTGCGSFSTDPLCEQLSGVLGGRELPRVRQGPFGLQYSYDPQWANWDPQFGRQSGLTEANQRRPVRLTPVDALNLEVAVPTHSVTLSDPTAVNANNLQESRLAVTGHAMVAAAGYAPGTDCRTVDPSIASTTLPVTRQGAQTRYWTPDPGAPASREGVINLTMPQLAAGEAVDICVFWYQLPTRSYDNVVVTAIERHTVVPPARAATELAFVGVGRGGDAPGTPAGSIEAELARWTFQVIGDRPLTTACGFPSGNAPDPVILRPLGDPGFLCRIGTSAFLFEPRDIELFTTDITTNRPEGRTRIHIDNRGCSMSDCGAPRRARIELSDGTWMDLSVRKVPFATTPMLPGGRIAAQWSADQWQIDPSGFQGVIPTLRTPVRQSAPALDTFGLRVRPNEANPSSALDLTWQADREATVMVSARALVPAYLAPTCQDTLVGPTQPANSGVLTVPGLCPNTEYAFAVTVVDATTGASQVYDWARGGTRLDLLSGLSFNLIGRTKAPVLPPEFIASWSVSAADPPLGSPASLAPGTHRRDPRRPDGADRRAHPGLPDRCALDVHPDDTRDGLGWRVRQWPADRSDADPGGIHPRRTGRGQLRRAGRGDVLQHPTGRRLGRPQRTLLPAQRRRRPDRDAHPATRHARLRWVGGIRRSCMPPAHLPPAHLPLDRPPRHLRWHLTRFPGSCFCQETALSAHRAGTPGGGSAVRRHTPGSGAQRLGEVAEVGDQRGHVFVGVGQRHEPLLVEAGRGEDVAVDAPEPGQLGDPEVGRLVVAVVAHRRRRPGDAALDAHPDGVRGQVELGDDLVDPVEGAHVDASARSSASWVQTRRPRGRRP